jgi:hypothetical protein
MERFESQCTSRPGSSRPNEKPAAYLFRAQGTAHVIYLGSASPSSQDLQIQEFWHDQNGWHANNLTRAAGSAPSPVRASPVAEAGSLRGLIRFQQAAALHESPLLARSIQNDVRLCHLADIQAHSSDVRFRG